MTLWRVCLCLGAAALLFGCAGSPIKPVELNAPGDAAPLFQELETYNRPPGIVRALGRLRLEGMGGADYGARVEPGRGVRLDVVTGALARLVLSATCNNESGCDFYLPELNTVYREADPWATRWLAALVTGRVPMIGNPGPGSAWEDSLGRRVLRFEGESGNWQLVVFSEDETLPEVVQYGSPGEPASVEISYGDFFKEGGRWFPGWMVLLGEDSKEGARFEPKHVGIDKTGSDHPFSLRIPAGVRIVDDAEGIWRKLGLPWTP